MIINKQRRDRDTSTAASCAPGILLRLMTTDSVTQSSWCSPKNCSPASESSFPLNIPLASHQFYRDYYTYLALYNFHCHPPQWSNDNISKGCWWCCCRCCWLGLFGEEDKASRKGLFLASITANKIDEVHRLLTLEIIIVDSMQTPPQPSLWMRKPQSLNQSNSDHDEEDFKQ